MNFHVPVPQLLFDAEKSVECLAERSDVVKVVQYDDARQIVGSLLALVGDVRQVLAQFLARLVVDIELGYKTGARFLSGSEETRAGVFGSLNISKLIIRR